MITIYIITDLLISSVGVKKNYRHDVDFYVEFYRLYNVMDAGASINVFLMKQIVKPFIGGGLQYTKARQIADYTR